MWPLLAMGFHCRCGYTFLNSLLLLHYCKDFSSCSLRIILFF